LKRQVEELEERCESSGSSDGGSRGTPSVAFPALPTMPTSNPASKTSPSVSTSFSSKRPIFASAVSSTTGSRRPCDTLSKFGNTSAAVRSRSWP
jgi:hypothetical protein